MKSKQFGRYLLALALLIPVCLAFSSEVFAAVGAPEPWQMNMTAGFSPTKARLNEFHNELLVIISLIVVLVFLLMAYIAVRFNAKAHPVASTTTHHTLLEVAWTLIPILILMAIAVPSFKLLYYLDRTPKADMTINVTGHQWYWSYTYADAGNLTFDSTIVSDDDLKKGDLRQLTVDNALVLPVGAKVRILVSSTDVMHSWLVPPLGVQMYATPGRTNETWVEVSEEGTFYGQCNQICGINHGYMPIMIQGIPKDQFPAWIEAAKKKYASNDGATASTQLADAASVR
jgi:cytochrome c oxidase subunit 2